MATPAILPVPPVAVSSGAGRLGAGLGAGATPSHGSAVVMPSPEVLRDWTAQSEYVDWRAIVLTVVVGLGLVVGIPMWESVVLWWRQRR